MKHKIREEDFTDKICRDTIVRSVGEGSDKAFQVVTDYEQMIVWFEVKEKGKTVANTTCFSYEIERYNELD